MKQELEVIIEMAKDAGLTPIGYMIENLGWDNLEASNWLVEAEWFSETLETA